MSGPESCQGGDSVGRGQRRRTHEQDLESQKANRGSPFYEGRDGTLTEYLSRVESGQGLVGVSWHLHVSATSTEPYDIFPFLVLMRQVY